MVLLRPSRWIAEDDRPTAGGAAVSRSCCADGIGCIFSTLLVDDDRVLFFDYGYPARIIDERMASPGINGQRHWPQIGVVGYTTRVAGKHNKTLLSSASLPPFLSSSLLIHVSPPYSVSSLRFLTLCFISSTWLHHSSVYLLYGLSDTPPHSDRRIPETPWARPRFRAAMRAFFPISVLSTLTLLLRFSPPTVAVPGQV